MPPDDVSLAMSSGVLLRRHLDQPWLKPMARVGVYGSDEYPLDPMPSLALETFPRKTPGADWLDTCANTKVSAPSATDHTFATEMIARSSGELFLYLNDAIFPLKDSLLYCNNEGSGRVAVERVVP